MGLPVNASALLSGLGATIGRQFWDTYEQEYKGEEQLVNAVSNADIPSNVQQQPEGYFQTSPYPRIWLPGNPASAKPFGSVQFVIYNRSWVSRVEYNEDDVVYDQTRSLLLKAQGAGTHWKTLRARILFQFMTAASNPLLVPGTILAPDGAAMFATTAGGAARYGISGGNAPTAGAYMDSSSEVLAGIAVGLNQAGQWQDTEGEPLLDPGVLSECIVVAPLAYATSFREAFGQNPVTSSGAGATGNAGVTNWIFNSGVQFKLWLTPRLTAKAFYMFFPRVNKQPFGCATVTPLREVYGDMTNSDGARTTKIFYNQWDERFGAYLADCFNCIKITDNT